MGSPSRPGHPVQACLDEPAARETPISWSRHLCNIPAAYRETVLAGAWQAYDQLHERLWADPHRRSQAHNSGEMTALSLVSYASYLPFHLVHPEQQPQALQALREGPHQFLQWTRQTYANADRLLLISDAPDPATLQAVLDEQLGHHPAETLVCGPGHHLEPAVRAYARERGYTSFHVVSLDADAQGRVWDAVPGPRLDEAVQRLFTELKPARVIAFEPVQMPNTLQVMEHARRLNIPVLLIDEPVRHALPSV